MFVPNAGRRRSQRASAAQAARPWRSFLPLACLLLSGSLGLAACSTPQARGAGTGRPAGSDVTTSTAQSRSVTNWEGTDPPCKVLVSSSKGLYIYGTFRTCPPKRVLLIGDSIALTLGFGLGTGEEKYGVVLTDSAISGCGWINGPSHVIPSGAIARENPPCAKAFSTWEHEESRLDPQAVVIELGHWDCFDLVSNGHTSHIGQAAVDGRLVAAMSRLLKALTAKGVPVILLTVPVLSRLDLGHPDPAADPLRRSAINGLLAKVAKTIPEVHIFDINPIIAPGGRYAAEINGRACRTPDGVHIAEYCGVLVQKKLLPYIRQVIALHHGA
jgi:hypothetical protein